MTLAWRRPAPVLELAAMNALLPPAAATAKGNGTTLGEAARHSALTRSIAAYMGEACLVCAGLYEADARTLDAWFSCRPEAAAHLGAIVKFLRLTLSAIAQTEGLEIRARVAVGWRAGERLAALLGFSAGEVAGAVRVWRRGDFDAR